MPQLLIAAIVAYLIGSIPTSYIVSRLSKGIDIRQYGSGNIGATNTLRVLGKKMGAIVLVIDVLKGVFCVLVLPKIFFHAQAHLTLTTFKAFMAASAVFGHVWAIFLKFKGGKGVATTLGVFLALSPKPAIAAILIWLLVVVVTKYVSLSSLIMMLSLPVFMFMFNQPFSYMILSILLCVLIFYTHNQNIKRLTIGKEHKITKKMASKG